MDKKLLKSILLIITYAVALVLLVTHFDSLLGLLGTLLVLFRPLFIGFAIAFVLNRPCQLFQRLYSRALGKGKAKALSGPLAVGSAYLGLFLLVIAFISVVLPRLVESIQLFLGSINGYLANTQKWLDSQGWLHSLFATLNLEELDLSNLGSIIRDALSSVVNTLTTALPHLITTITDIISVIVAGFLSVIFSIYMLSSKTTLLAQLHHLLDAYVPDRWEAPLLDVAHLTADTFTAFVTGQLVEACIIGGVTTVGMLFIQPDYAPLIGMILTATALIPMVGCFVGGAISAALLIMVSPLKTLIFLIFLLCVQQFEGNIIYPRVVGSNIGLPAIWVLTAVTVGGGLLGFVGILISVPIASVFYTLLRRDVHRRLKDAK